jgi:hypothetical protein
MKKIMVIMGILGAALLVGGVSMVLVSKGSSQIQIGGLVMMICAIPAIMEVRIMKVERRLRKLEGKPTD